MVAETPAKVAQAGADVLAWSYGLWAVAALSRAAYQYAFRRPADLAPTHISAFVGALYVAIILGLRRRSPGAWRATLALLVLELSGVLLVGAIDTIWRPFPYTSVWSGFGAGYLFMPLILPVAGIAWLVRAETRRAYGIGLGRSPGDTDTITFVREQDL